MWRRHGVAGCGSLWWSTRTGCRLGLAYLETRFDVLSVHIVVTADQEPEGAPAELVKDSLGIVTSFSGKWYGLRGGRRARAAVKASLVDVGAGAVGG